MSSWLWSTYYGVRSQPKFIVWILNSSSKFLNFYLNFIAEYNILYSSFRFRITGKRFYTRLLFLNSTLLFDLARRIFSTRFHQNYTFRVIFQTRPWKFLTRRFRSRFSGRWSRPSVGGWVVGGSLVHHALRLFVQTWRQRTCCSTRNFGAFIFLSGRWL